MKVTKGKAIKFAVNIIKIIAIVVTCYIIYLACDGSKTYTTTGEIEVLTLE